MKKRTNQPSAADYRNHSPALRECPACNRWDIEVGYTCSHCSASSWPGFDWNDEGQYFKKDGGQ